MNQHNDTTISSTHSAYVSPHSGRLFQRVCHIVERHFTDPTIGPAEIAAEAGISLRYLQKLFTCRGTTCSHYIQSLRLGHAFTLLAGRADVNGVQSISEIAWASGYRDLCYFHRVFRRRFGRSPASLTKRSCQPRKTVPRQARSHTLFDHESSTGEINSPVRRPAIEDPQCPTIF
jgi:AraC family transcriptional regulator, positive regulator of tynA and feaB